MRSCSVLLACLVVCCSGRVRLCGAGDVELRVLSAEKCIVLLMTPCHLWRVLRGQFRASATCRQVESPSCDEGRSPDRVPVREEPLGERYLTGVGRSGSLIVDANKSARNVVCSLQPSSSALRMRESWSRCRVSYHRFRCYKVRGDIEGSRMKEALFADWCQITTRWCCRIRDSATCRCSFV